MKTRKRVVFAATLAGICASVFADVTEGRPERMAFPFRETVSASGTYEAASVGTNFVLTGEWTGNVTVTNTSGTPTA